MVQKPILFQRQKRQDHEGRCEKRTKVKSAGRVPPHSEQRTHRDEEAKQSILVIQHAKIKQAIARKVAGPSGNVGE